LAFFIIRQQDTNQLPKSGGMIVTDQVTQFMGYDIIDQRQRSHHNAPVETNTALMVTTCPSFLLAPYQDFGRGDP
jgi:hypothetical protein